MTAQRRYQIKRNAAGFCCLCPGTLSAESRAFCDNCLRKRRERGRVAARKKHGWNEWVPGGPGHPPKITGTPGSVDPSPSLSPSPAEPQ